MTEAVVDTSALVESLIGHDPDTELRWWIAHRELCAPEIIDLEALNVIRALVRASKFSEGEAKQVIAKLSESPIQRIAHRPLMSRIWDLKDNATPYDAAYIALAEFLDVPLLTCDSKLAKVPGQRATILRFGNSS